VLNLGTDNLIFSSSVILGLIFRLLLYSIHQTQLSLDLCNGPLHWVTTKIDNVVDH